MRCLRLTLTAGEVAARRGELERMREELFRATRGAVNLEVAVHELGTTALGMTAVEGAWWHGPRNVGRVVAPRLSPGTDAIFFTSSVRDASSGLHHAVAFCGGTAPAELGIGGAGYSWVPATAPAYPFECGSSDVYAREWGHQIGEGLSGRAASAWPRGPPARTAIRARTR